MAFKLRTAAFMALASLILLSGCGRTPQLRVEDAELKLSPVYENPSALYFTVYGGPKDVYLLSVTSPSAIRTQMHESGKDAKTGMMTMAPLERVKIPADGKVEFRQGGKHVMVWNVNQIARRLTEMRTIFLFSNGDRILVDVPAVPIAGGDGHGSH